MTDPISRAAKRQNLLDRLAEHLTEWGCPPDLAATRSLALLHLTEAAGWVLPAHDAPPLTGRGSTEHGRARARLVFVHRAIDVDDAYWTVCACGGWRGPHEDHEDHVAEQLAAIGLEVTR